VGNPGSGLTGTGPGSHRHRFRPQFPGWRGWGVGSDVRGLVQPASSGDSRQYLRQQTFAVLRGKVAGVGAAGRCGRSAGAGKVRRRPADSAAAERRQSAPAF
jgi:hypothetical protein